MLRVRKRHTWKVSRALPLTAEWNRSSRSSHAAVIPNEHRSEESAPLPRIVKENAGATAKSLESYQALLPEKQRDHIPSLRSWYEKLSAPIHSAQPDDAL